MLQTIETHQTEPWLHLLRGSVFSLSIVSRYSIPCISAISSAMGDAAAVGLAVLLVDGAPFAFCADERRESAFPTEMLVEHG